MSTAAPASNARGEPKRLTYQQWATLLAAYFFRPEFDGVPVMFFVDDAAIASIYGGDADQAVSSLVGAVHDRLDSARPRQLFRHIEAEARRWKIAGGEPIPPFLPLLAVAVLAATRMRRTREHAGHNYYRPFRELLAVDVEIGELQASSGDALPYLWQYLQWWLDDKHRGRLGFSTIVSGYFHYSYADSQTLFSSSDRDKLTQFFRWIRLRPGERIEQSELMTYFRIWASKRVDLSEGTAHILESDEDSAQLAQIIKAAADRWRGVVREDGKRGAEILVTLELFPRPRIGLVAERPEGFPAELPCRSPLGKAITLTSSHSGWYDELPVAVTGALLDNGLRLAAENVQLRLPPYNIHVLEKNADLGKWASVAQISPAEPAWLLVRRSALEAVSRYLETSARRGWKVIQREGVAPPGWSLVGEILVDAATTQGIPGPLARIIPRVQNRFSLRGGLPVGRATATYLTKGEPDLWLPPESEDDRAFELRLDERAVELPPSVVRVRLVDRGLEQGSHTVKIEGVGRSFSTIRTLGHVAPRTERIIGHEISRSAARSIAISPGPSLGAECSTGAVRIVGAVVEDRGAVLGAYPPPPVILPTAAVRRQILGARPGEIAEIPAPRKPPWMARAGLSFQVFELTPGFEVVWIITEWNLEPTVRVRVSSSIPPEEPDPGVSEALMSAWAAAVLSAPPPSRLEAAELWTMYQERAAAESRA